MYRTRIIDRYHHAFPESPFYLPTPQNQGTFFKVTPDGWKEDRLGPWLRVYTERSLNELPLHGWKIHISSTPSHATCVLAKAAQVCARHRTPFKHLASTREYFRANGKYADRRSGGKFITIYPRSDSHFVLLLKELDRELKAYHGPYILTDARYGQGPVFFRYGAFFPAPSPMNNNTLGVRLPSGEWWEDLRDLGFTVPEFAKVPSEVSELVRSRTTKRVPKSIRLLAPYQVTESIHFSFGGGVYRGMHETKKFVVVLKEARSWAGYTSETVCATDRLRKEWQALQKLRFTRVVPHIYDYLECGEHEYLVEQFIDGPTLQEWVAQNFPFSLDRSFGDYEKLALPIAEQVVSIVDVVHQQGLAVMDLQPKNLIIDEKFKVWLIDLEGACNLTDRSPNVLGAPGYVPFKETSNWARDLYSLYQVLLYIFWPSMVSSLTPGLDHARIAEISRNYSPEVAFLLAKQKEKIPPDLLKPQFGLAAPAARAGSFSLLSDRIKRGIERALSMPHSAEVRFPGDARQFWAPPGGAIDIETGAAGVCLMLYRSGSQPDEDDINWILKSIEDASKLPLHGLLRGRVGVVAVLAELGFPCQLDRVLRECVRERTFWDISVRSGLSGTILAFLSISQGFELSQDFWLLVTQFRYVLTSGIGILPTGGAETGNPIGLFDGWSGVAVACEALYRHTNDEEWHRFAESFIARDYLELSEGPEGCLFVKMSKVHYSYLSEGSAGIGVASAIVQPNSREDIKIGIALGLKSRLSLNAGLFRGMAGWAAALSFMGFFQEIACEQLNTIERLYSVTFGDAKEVLFPGDHAFRLSCDYSTGAAGILGVNSSFQCGQPLWLPWCPSLFQVRKGGES